MLAPLKIWDVRKTLHPIWRPLENKASKCLSCLRDPRWSSMRMHSWLKVFRPRLLSSFIFCACKFNTRGKSSRLSNATSLSGSSGSSPFLTNNFFAFSTKVSNAGSTSTVAANTATLSQQSQRALMAWIAADDLPPLLGAQKYAFIGRGLKHRACFAWNVFHLITERCQVDVFPFCLMQF